MTTYQIIGATPVSFISEDTTGNVGKQYQIPISALTVTNGAPDATAWLKAVNITADPDLSLAKAIVADQTARKLLQVVVTSP